jgi:hypothetical protein
MGMTAFYSSDKKLRSFLHPLTPVPRPLFAFGASDGAVVFIFPVVFAIFSKYRVSGKGDDHQCHGYKYPGHDYNFYLSAS